MHCGAIFQPAIPETFRECFYTTPYIWECRRQPSCHLLEEFYFRPLYTCYGLEVDGCGAGALARHEGRLHLDHDSSAPHLEDE